jgi:ribose transport system permease protein
MTDAVDTSSPRDAGPQRAEPAPVATRSMAFAVQRYGLALLFLVVILGFSLLVPDSFPTLGNFQNITGNQSVLAIVTAAAIVPLICGHFDLSIGSNLGATSIATAWMLSNDHPLWLAVAVGIAIGAAIGVINGVLVAKVGVNALITTLGVGTVLAGLTFKFTDGQSIITGIPESLTDFGSGYWFGLPRTLYVLAIVALLVWYLLEHTPYGRELHAVGANPLAARLVGIRVDRVVILSFVIAGALVGFAGVLQVARQGGGNPQIAAAFTLTPLASAFLGATTIHPGRFNVPGMLLAVFFIATSVSGLNLVGVDTWVESVFNGTALVLSVTLSTVLGRRLAGA